MLRFESLTMARVAPHVGAWIETDTRLYTPLNRSSRPTWARGLKHPRSLGFGGMVLVAPHVGAWIETQLECDLSARQASRPTWARGLKREGRSPAEQRRASRPTWARGLKQVSP